MKNYRRLFIYLLLTFLGCIATYAAEEKLGRSFGDAIPIRFSDGETTFTDVRDSYWYDYSPYRYQADREGEYYQTYGNAVYYRLRLEYMSDVVIHNWESPEVNCSVLFLVAPVDPYAVPNRYYDCDSVSNVAVFHGGEVPDFDSLGAPLGTSRVLGYLRAERVPKGTYYLIVAGSKYMNGSIPNGLLRTTVTANVCPFVPDETDYSSQYNSVHILTPTVAGDTVFLFSTVDSSRREIQYYDGLGRPVQRLAWQFSTKGRNLVSRQEYDILGREYKQWLPLPYEDKHNLSFVPDINLENESGLFYKDSCAFSFSIYDDSPLNRIKEYYGAGKPWHANGRSVKHDYRANTDEDSCLNFYVSGSREQPVLSFSSVNSSYSLAIVETQDEDGCRNSTFTDKQGQTILERSITKTDTLDTYYVYDDYGNLCFVLPPAASQNLPLLFQTGENINEVLNQYTYQYRYDYCNRCNGKKLPGCDWVEMLYDAGNRLVFSQDGCQRGRGEWSFSFSDLFGRIVLKGIYQDQPDEQDCALSNTYATFEPANAGAIYGYVIHVPATIKLDSLKVLQADYYDTYDYRSYLPGIVSSLDYIVDENYGKLYEDNSEVPLHCKGLLTGNMTTTLGVDRKLYGCYYYDYNRNLIQERHTMLNGEIASYRYSYDFSGQPVKSAESYGSGIEFKRVYSYDHVGRLLEERHVLKNDTTRFVYDYDALGRVKSLVRIHDRNSLSTEKEYNIRNWLTAILNPHFTQELHYTDGAGTACYNGNISSMMWKQSSDVESRGYNFEYDDLNRLKNAVYGEGVDLCVHPNRFNEQVTGYDKMGNILGLLRYGKTKNGDYGLLDNLRLSYGGNQLLSVYDNATLSTSSTGMEFVDRADSLVEYAYDANGNLTKDLNKKIADIQYNVLNLPRRIVFEDGNSISYLYDVNGVKLRALHIMGNDTVTTDYCGSVIYENGVAEKLLTGYGYITLNDNKYHHFIQDHQSNNRVIVDQKGKVEEVNHYYPFGGLMTNSTGSVQPYKYNGKEFEVKGGLNLYDYEARRYDPVIGRFITMDPMAEMYYECSPYSYCLGNPVNLVDPDGLQSEPVVNLPELVVVGTKVAEPISGFWENLKYYILGRTVTLPVYGIDDKGNWSDNPIMHITYNVNKDGFITSIAPIGGTAPVPATSALSLKDIAKLLQSARTTARGGLTLAGRAFKKHSDRPNSPFPKAVGNPSALNQQAEKLLKSILEHPNVERTVNDVTQTLKSSRFGANSVDYHIPGGIGARFDANGTFITFLNPKK